MNNLYQVIKTRFPDDLEQSLFELPLENRRYSFRDADTYSARYARVLLSLGVQQGDRVLVQVEKSPEAVFLYLACLRTGAIFVPLNTGYRNDEVAYFVDDAQPTLLVCPPEQVTGFEKLISKHPSTSILTLGREGEGTLPDRARYQADQFETLQLPPSATASILYTSGTTGRSKGVMLTHHNLLSNAEMLRQAWGFEQQDRLIHALPIFHVHGLFVALNIALLSGSSIYFLTRFDPERVIELMEDATVLMGVPTFYTRLLASNKLNQQSCRNMRLFISGSAPLLPATFNAFNARTGHCILERYGMTETLMNSSNPLDGDRKLGSVGFPLPGVEIRIRGSEGELADQGEAGEIEIRGDNLFDGYWRMTEKTAEELRPDGFFKTGDIGLFDKEGYLFIVGRLKDLIISGGLNVYPKEIESIIDTLDDIAESAVIGVPHPDFGEGVVAVVTPQHPERQPDEQQIIQATRTRLASFKTPKAVLVVEELPRNAMGKVEKNKLRERFTHLFDS